MRGDSQAPLYWNRPDKTAETMREGWICTGDRFRVDADGFYFFEGRIDDLIKVSGQWIYPLEIERCLAEHPSVQECAVLGVEGANRLMTLAAFVVLRPGVEAGEETTRLLQNFVKSQLTPYKYPRRVDYLDALPKTGTDKIDRQALRRAAAGKQVGRPPAARWQCPAYADGQPLRSQSHQEGRRLNWTLPAGYRGLIFDCDGTLVDSMPLHYHAWVTVLRRYDLELQSEARFYGRGALA